jgi:ribosome-associated protein
MPLAKLVKKLRQNEENFLATTLQIGALAAGRRASDIRAYDVRKLTLIADSFVICTASSQPQVKAIFDAVKEGMSEIGVRPAHVEGGPRDGWLLMDYGAVIFHIFREESREFYDLDGLWGDAPQIDLGLED